MLGAELLCWQPGRTPGGPRCLAVIAAVSGLRPHAGAGCPRGGQSVRERPPVCLRASGSDDLGGGSILAQLALLEDDEFREAEDVIDEDLSESLRLQAERLRMQQMEDSSPRDGPPELLPSVLESLFPPDSGHDGELFDGIYVDGTFGRGDFSQRILKRLSKQGRLFAFDIDGTALNLGLKIEQDDSRFKIFHRPYAELAEVLPDGPVNGVVLDLGISSFQLEDEARGFSLRNIGISERPLDLRMNPDAGISVAEWLKAASTEELAWVLDRYGHGYANTLKYERVAQAVMDDQKLNGPYTSMKRFVEVVNGPLLWPDEETAPAKQADNPARFVLYALRMFMNRETEQLRAGLEAAFKVLAMGGRCVVSIYSREDASTVTGFFREHEEPDAEAVSRLGSGRRLRELYPLVGTGLGYAVRLVGKPVRASEDEVLRSPRSRFWSLYVLEKAPRQTKVVRAKPRLHRNRFRAPALPSLVTGQEEEG